MYTSHKIVDYCKTRMTWCLFLAQGPAPRTAKFLFSLQQVTPTMSTSDDYFREHCILRRAIRDRLAGEIGAFLTGHEAQYLFFDDPKIAKYMVLKTMGEESHHPEASSKAFSARLRRNAMINNGSDLDYLVESFEAEQRIIKALQKMESWGRKYSVSYTPHFNGQPNTHYVGTGFFGTFNLTSIWVMRNNLAEVKVDIVRPIVNEPTRYLTRTDLFKTALPFPDILSTLVMTENNIISFRSAPDMLRVNLWNAWPALQKMNDEGVTVTDQVLRNDGKFSSDHNDVLNYFQRIIKVFKQNKTIANIKIRYDTVGEKFSIFCRNVPPEHPTGEWRDFTIEEITEIVQKQSSHALAVGELWIDTPPSTVHLYCDPRAEWLTEFCERFPQMSNIV